MKLVAGLGNPGQAYQFNYHNLGFITLDLLASHLNCNFKFEEKFNSSTTSGKLEQSPFLLVKPQTFMNLSGQAISKALNYYKLSISDLIVVHDDIDLNVGDLRYRQSGSHGGNNGLRSIIEQLGTTEFSRLKIGVGRHQFKDAASHVLSNISDQDQPQISAAVKEAAKQLQNFITDKPIKIVNNANQNNNGA